MVFFNKSNIIISGKKNHIKFTIYTTFLGISHIVSRINIFDVGNKNNIVPKQYDFALYFVLWLGKNAKFQFVECDLWRIWQFHARNWNCANCARKKFHARVAFANCVCQIRFVNANSILIHRPHHHIVHTHTHNSKTQRSNLSPNANYDHKWPLRADEKTHVRRRENRMYVRAFFLFFQHSYIYGCFHCLFFLLLFNSQLLIFIFFLATTCPVLCAFSSGRFGPFVRQMWTTT